MPFVVDKDTTGEAQLRSSRLVVHDSEHDLFILTLDIEEQVRK
jgi:hypothetical protein